jgi:hypothetical protein
MAGSKVTDIEDECSNQSSLNYVTVRSNHRTDRNGLPVALDPRTEFVKVLRAGLLGDAPQRPHVDLVMERYWDGAGVRIVVRGRFPAENRVVTVRPVPLVDTAVHQYLHDLPAGKRSAGHTSLEHV